MSDEVYKVIEANSDRSLGYYKAKDKRVAKKAALANIVVRKLSGSEVLDVMASGYAITDCSSNQPELPIEAQGSQG